MKRKRGFSIMEVMLATAITSIVVAAVASVYSFSATRTAHAMAAGTATLQVHRLTQELDKYLGQATLVQTVTLSGTPAIKCTMPEIGTDFDGDTVPDKFEPKAIVGGEPTWSRGKRVWFYMSDTTGAFGRPQTILWMAVRNDDLSPNATNTIRSFTYMPDNATLRFGLLDSVTWTVNASAKTAGYTLKASALARADRKSATAYTTESSIAQTMILSRTVFWENWRQ